jgi:uncharacterized protein (TIGR03083 family)
MGTLNKALYLAALQRDAQAFVGTARRGMDPDVPGCPGWTVHDLVIHLGDVYTFWTLIVESRARDAGPIRERLAPERENRNNDPAFQQPDYVLEWFRECAGKLEKTLAAADPDEPVFTWWPPDQHAGWVQRRMALETAVHRWDIEQAHGIEQPIEQELARDGVDEALDVHLPDRVSDTDTRGNGETFHFHQTDGDGEWAVRFGSDGVTVTREHVKADVAVRGSASDLLLFQWGRIGADRLEVIGDIAVLDRYFELAPP